MKSYRSLAAGLISLAMLTTSVAEAGVPSWLRGTKKEVKKLRTYDFMQLEDIQDIAKVLHTHVAHVVVEVDRVKSKNALIDERDGFGVVLEPDLVAALCFIVEHAKSVTINGPKGKVSGEVVLYDVERRVALIRTKVPLAKAGLHPAKLSPVSKRVDNAVLFALLSTEGIPAVIHGWMIADGTAEEFEGHPRVSFKLVHGTPVFDTEARFVGYSRAVSWDVDKQLLIVPEMITAARTATGAADKKALSADKKK